MDIDILLSISILLVCYLQYAIIAIILTGEAFRGLVGYAPHAPRIQPRPVCKNCFTCLTIQKAQTVLECICCGGQYFFG